MDIEEIKSVEQYMNIVDTGHLKENIEKIISDKKKIDVSTLNQDVYDIDDIKVLKNGTCTIINKGVPFACHINITNSDKLYVFLSGRANGNTYFHRWSWNSNENTISIADPMYTYHGYDLGWYIGTKEQDYRQLTSEIICTIAEILKVPTSKIVIYGSSMGGTASLFISTYIHNPNSRNLVTRSVTLDYAYACVHQVWSVGSPNPNCS